MKSQKEVRDLNTFREGQYVDIVGVVDMQHLKIERISDSGVTVTGGSLSPHTVISGRSPAVASDENSNSNEGSQAKPSAKMSNIKLPDDIFTTQELADFNGIPIPYAAKWIKENCIDVGKVEKEPGQRGRSATLFQVIKLDGEKEAS